MHTQITVANAGLVLLWPFLPRLFEALELMERTQFHSEAHQQRAVSLLGVIATGEANTTDVVLANLLCGLPPDHPKLAPFELKYHERSLSEDMLRAVTQVWPGLKATSPDGLRQAFLMRDGKLQSDPTSKTPQSVALEVVKGPFDMLLDELNWTISTVSLPWMVAPVSVIWR